MTLLAVGMIAFAISPPMGQPSDPEPQSVVANAARPVQAKVAQRPANQSAGFCTDALAGRLIKEELFRRAGTVRGAAAAKLESAGYASLRLESARQKSEKPGAMDCSGWVALDLPRGLVVDGARTNLNAEISYALILRRGHMAIASLSGEGRLVRSLATLGPTPKEPEQDKSTEPVEVASAAVRKAPVVVADAKRPAAAAASLRARRPKSPAEPAAASACSGSRADKIVCGNINLSSLDRQLSLLYRQSWTQADEKKRAALLGTRQHFNDRRAACASPNCMTSAYLSRLKEISDIMAGRKLQ